MASSPEFPTTYVWRTPDGYAEDHSAHADTPIGRIKVMRRRQNVNKWVAWVKGEVLGRDYINMDTAKRAAENKVRKIMDKDTSGE